MTSVTDSVSSGVTFSNTPLTMFSVSALYNAWYICPTVYIDEAISGFGFQALF
jgi:hypothetical protein